MLPSLTIPVAIIPVYFPCVFIYLLLFFLCLFVAFTAVDVDLAFEFFYLLVPDTSCVPWCSFTRRWSTIPSSRVPFGFFFSTAFISLRVFLSYESSFFDCHCLCATTLLLISVAIIAVDFCCGFLGFLPSLLIVFTSIPVDIAFRLCFYLFVQNISLVFLRVPLYRRGSGFGHPFTFLHVALYAFLLVQFMLVLLLLLYV